MVRGEPVPPRRPKVTHFDRLAVSHRVIESARPIDDSDVPDADVIVATWWETAEWVSRMSPAKGAKVLFVQGYEVSGAPTDVRLEATWRLPMHKVVVSSWLQTLARDRFGDAHASLVTNPVDTQRFDAPPRAKQRVPTVGLVYSPAACKGPDLLARALRFAVTRIPNLRIVAFGLDPLQRSAGFPSSMRFERQPVHTRIVELYSSCDAWLFGSRAEGFGLPILEAMACRTPVIATPAGAAPELLAGGGGFLVGAEDSEAIASRIEQVAAMTDPQWQEMSERARATALRYDADASAATLEAALDLAVLRAERGEIAGGAGLVAP